MRLLTSLLVLALPLAAARTLDFHFIDVEGGQATLIVTPAGESMLVDVGWPGFNGRDADRIAAAARKAGLKQIDYLLMTHYHMDHVGGVTQLLERVKVGTFIDHGPNTETGERPAELSAAWDKAVATGKHLVVKPGDKLPLKGLDIDVVAARGELIKKPLQGAGAQNSLCAAAERRKPDPSENARSIGFLLRYGKFSFVDLGDLTWEKELELACPANLLGSVDVYLTTHHGMNMSGPAAIVHALRPRVAIMNNGARKGGTPEAWKVITSSPGLEDLWQIHFALAGGQEHNSSEKVVVNHEEQCQGLSLVLSASADGSFTVTNTRNGFRKAYKPAAR